MIHRAIGRTFLVAITAATAVIPAAAPYGGTAVAVGGHRPSPGAAVRIQQVTDSQAAAAESYWTPQRMRDATAADGSGGSSGASTGPRVGRLFYRLGGKNFGCTGSVVASRGGDAVLTAAHCLNLSGIPLGGLLSVFVPGYDNGTAPFGTWGVKSASVPRKWAIGQNIDADYGVVRVRAHGGKRLAAVTGANPYRLRAAWTGRATLVGYPNGADDPALCRNTRLAKEVISGHKPEYRFLCKGFTAGVSGSPLLAGPAGRTERGEGTVIGVLGGLRGGGDPEVDGDISFANRLDADFAAFWAAQTR